MENDHPTWNQPDSMWCSKHPFPKTHQIIVRCSFSYCTRPVDEQIPSAPKRLGSSCGKLCRKLAMAPTWFHPKMVGESCYPIYLLGEYNLYNQYIYIYISIIICINFNSLGSSDSSDPSSRIPDLDKNSWCQVLRRHDLAAKSLCVS